MKILPSNSKYSFILIGLLGLSVGFFTWYGAEGKYRVAVQSTVGGKLVEQGDQHLLWAGGTPGTSSAIWFDVTDSLINPRNFHHGIGKDKIASIDAPEFVENDDPMLERLGISMETRVIGYAFEGEARAYPVRTMNRHEIVNDTFGDTHLTVAW